MPFLEVMHQYFRGEKLEAWFFILPLGVTLIGFGVTALRVERGGFAWGVAVPAILFGLVLVGTGLGVGLRTDGQVAGLERGFGESPAAFVHNELPRMKKVNANFRLTFVVFGVVAAIGLLFHYAAGTGWGRGLGAVLILIGGLGLLIDAFAEHRALPYTTALEELADGGRSSRP